jgi:hypothetical protein
MVKQQPFFLLAMLKVAIPCDGITLYEECRIPVEASLEANASSSALITHIMHTTLCFINSIMQFSIFEYG